jgi:hypothetical protein
MLTPRRRVSGVRFGFKKKIDSLSEGSVHGQLYSFYCSCLPILSFKVLIEGTRGSGIIRCRKPGLLAKIEL